jgi:predicted  nucleic acid-binding Zn-ribbon protein
MKSGQGRHEGACDIEAVDQAMKDLAAQEGWPTCPGCSRMVELNLGCFHIT